MSGTIEAWRVTEARTCTIAHDDSEIVLKLTGHDGRVEHLLFARKEFARFARQLHIDAQLLGHEN